MLDDAIHHICNMVAAVDLAYKAVITASGGVQHVGMDVVRDRHTSRILTAAGLPHALWRWQCRGTLPDKTACSD